MFLIPVGIAAFKAITAITAAKIVTTAVVGGGVVLAAKALHDAGRRKGQAEGKEAYAVEIQAMRERLDEMEYGD